jgi:DNA-binding protein HU-beta
MAKMTKSALMSALAEKSGLAKKQVVELLDILTALAYSEVKKNGEFVVPGFGKLVKVARKAREGRNPATGETIKIPAKTVVKFRVAKACKESCLSK